VRPYVGSETQYYPTAGQQQAPVKVNHLDKPETWGLTGRDAEIFGYFVQDKHNGEDEDYGPDDRENSAYSRYTRHREQNPGMHADSNEGLEKKSADVPVTVEQKQQMLAEADAARSKWSAEYSKLHAEQMPKELSTEQTRNWQQKHNADMAAAYNNFSHSIREAQRLREELSDAETQSLPYLLETGSKSKNRKRGGGVLQPPPSKKNYLPQPPTTPYPNRKPQPPTTPYPNRKPPRK
jgi:hypothetical protein